MLLSRREYDDKTRWERLRHVTEQLRAVAEERKLALDIPRSAGLGRIRTALEEHGAPVAEAVRDAAFALFGELGDKESLRPFLLEELPATTPQPLAGLPAYPEDISPSLGLESEDDDRRGDRWFIVERSDDGDTLHVLRERTFYETIRNPVTGVEELRARTQQDDLDLRLDRGRKTIFVAGTSASTAAKLARAVVVNAMPQAGLSLQALPELNVGVLEAVIDSFGGRPTTTNISPSDTELLPLRRVGTRQIDLRKHATIQELMRLGEQTALAGMFDRAPLGGSNACPVEVGIDIDVQWTLTPGGPVEPQMLMAIYDRMQEFARVARLLTPIPRQVHEQLRTRLGARLTPVRTTTGVTTVRTALEALGAPGRPTEEPAARLFDTAVLGIIVAVGRCPVLRARPRRRVLWAKELEHIVDELIPTATKAERDRVRDVVEDLVDRHPEYRDLLVEAQTRLINAGC